MAEFPALQLWTDAYLGDTTHLTTIEHGAYFLLLVTAWRTKDTRLPDDDKLLARYARCSPAQWKRLRSILAPFFRIENGFWTQGRLTDEAAAVRQRKEKAAKAGKASALKKLGRHATGVESELPASDDPEATQARHYHSHSQVVPLDKESNGAEPDSDAAFWASAKAYLGKSKASMIGQWVRVHGKAETASAITAAQLDRAVDPIEFIQGRFRRAKAQPAVPL